MQRKKKFPGDSTAEGREEYFMDIDRMISEGLGGGQVTRDNGLIEETAVPTMDQPDSATDPEE